MKVWEKKKRYLREKGPNKKMYESKKESKNYYIRK